MLIDTLTDLALMLLSIVLLYLSLFSYARRRQPHWHRSLQERRAVIVLLLTLVVVAIRVSKAVLGGHTSEFDIALLEYIHQHTSTAAVSAFSWITLTGSSRFLTPLGALLCAALLLARQYREALLLPLSMISAALLVYAIKLAVARERPALWATDWYWGYSFPSGHTMGTAACATALALCAAQLWPASRRYALCLAGVWIGLVAASRLVLGVHWPTDVLVAACLGIVLPILIRLTAGIAKSAAARTENP
ncbi:phosphatase PAP2 family protein [Halopseudomonas sabulinigri]|uniref:undecaprenyl-diphosphate phosphatase n=1 Tax=Halopseudomonas sabulinigri TaxID=472181 RepID=A0ABP9ZP58_9GAMM